MDDPVGLTPEPGPGMEAHPHRSDESWVTMRLATILLGVVLLAVSGCASLWKHQDEPKPDFKPNEPTREMLF